MATEDPEAECRVVIWGGGQFSVQLAGQAGQQSQLMGGGGGRKMIRKKIKVHVLPSPPKGREGQYSVLCMPKVTGVIPVISRKRFSGGSRSQTFLPIMFLC